MRVVIAGRLLPWHIDKKCAFQIKSDQKFAAAETLLDVDLANDIVTLAVASGEAGPFQQVLREYKMVSNLPEALHASLEM